MKKEKKTEKQKQFELLIACYQYQILCHRNQVKELENWLYKETKKIFKI